MTKSNELITTHKYLIMFQLKTLPPLSFYLDDVFYQNNELAASFKNISVTWRNPPGSQTDTNKGMTDERGSCFITG